MQTETFELLKVRYNPVEEAFQARARVSEGGRVFEYAVDYSAPVSSDDFDVRQGLVAAADLAHHSAYGAIRLCKFGDYAPALVA